MPLMNARKTGIVLIGAMCLLLTAQCGKKMTEDQYIQEAQNYLDNGRYHEAISLYEELAEKFPDSDFVPKALFMTGFLYANELNEPEKAKSFYSAFLNRFPDDELAVSVKWEMENIGVDINEIIGQGDGAEEDVESKSSETKKDK